MSQEAYENLSPVVSYLAAQFDEGGSIHSVYDLYYQLAPIHDSSSYSFTSIELEGVALASALVDNFRALSKECRTHPKQLLGLSIAICVHAAHADAVSVNISP